MLVKIYPSDDLQSAVNAVPQSTEIEVIGTHSLTSTVYIDNQVRLVGNGVLRCADNSNMDSMLYIRAANTVVEGINFDGNSLYQTSGLGRAIRIGASGAGAQIFGAKISDTFGSAITTESSTKIVGNIIIDNCIIENAGGRAIWIANMTDVSISRCNLHNLALETVRVQNTDNVLINNCRITQNGGNRIPTRQGINTSNSVGNIQVIGCSFHNLQNDAVDYHNVNGGLISGCLVDSTADSGLMVALDSYNVTVTGCYVKNTTFNAFGATHGGGNVSDVLFVGNFAEAAGGVGFQVASTGQNFVNHIAFVGNIAKGCSTGFGTNGAGLISDIAWHSNMAVGSTVSAFDDQSGVVSSINNLTW